MLESSLQIKVDMLIMQLREEVDKLSSRQRGEVEQMREANIVDLKNLNDHFEKRLSLVDSEYRLRVSNLQNEIDYLKELNLAQRLMMEDSLGYIKRLEEKLKSMRFPE